MRQAFDLKAAISDAWTFIWAQRAKEPPPSYRAETHTYLTASDIEAQVRMFAEEQRDGVPRGSKGMAWGRHTSWPPIKISTGGRGALLGVCRDWLLSEFRAGRIEAHNFGRHHISGMRFRPKGSGMSEPEKKTMEAKKAREGKPRPWHYREPSKVNILCQAARKRSWYGRGSKACSTRDKSKVTCARCLKALKLSKETEAA